MMATLIIKQIFLFSIICIIQAPHTSGAGAGKTCKLILKKVESIRANVKQQLQFNLAKFHDGLANLTNITTCENGFSLDDIEYLTENVLKETRILIKEELAGISSCNCGSDSNLRDVLEGVIRNELVPVQQGIQDLDRECKDQHVETEIIANVALGKPAMQSSTWSFGRGQPGIAPLAADGDVFNNLGHSSSNCSRTGKQAQPWWQIDLKQTFRILAVEVVTRSDCCAIDDGLHDFSILVSKDGSVWDAVCHHFPYRQSYMRQTYHCRQIHTGRFVRLQSSLRKTSKGIPILRSLLLCEVFIRATTLNEESPTREKDTTCTWKEEPLVPWVEKPEATVLENVGKNMPTLQSTTWGFGRGQPGVAHLAVDGDDYNVISSHNSNCSRTQLDEEGWWQVDLMQSLTLMAVEIVTRSDCCTKNELTDFSILVSTDDSEWKPCLVFKGGQSYMRQTYHCTTLETGRYVRIQMNLMKTSLGVPIKRNFILCEVLIRARVPYN